ncbi:MAG: DUF2336 domain-containing protein [Parvularculaceae bacterium]|nr:DUF2336 domain-containing protein [Amphiplicatus sp.]
MASEIASPEEAEAAESPAVAESAPGALSAPSSPRDLMVRKLIDIIVLPASRISANERSLTADILLQIADKVEESLRIEIAKRVARVPEAPPVLVRMLLLDEPSVAAPIIKGAENLPEALLLEAVKNGVTAHREMIARRLDLTTPVVDCMLEFNEPEVARCLLRREEFAFSPWATDILVSRSTTDTDLQALLLRRRELEPAHGFMMFWWVDSERRKRILSRFSLDRSILQDALRDLYPPTFRPGATPDPIVKEILTMLDRRHRPRGLNGETVTMDVVKRTLAASRDYPAQEITLAVSMIAGISLELAARILRDASGEPFAVTCKSLGVSRGDFYEMITNGGGALPTEHADELLAVFDSISRDFSRAILRYWDWDGNPRIARITRLLNVDIAQ